MPDLISMPGLTEAAAIARTREILPTALDTAGLRDRIAAEIRIGAVFTARGTNAQFLTVIKDVMAKLSAGEIGMADARVILGETLRAIGYTPESGFPDTPAGAVPPAVAGSLQDLRSFRRLDLIVRTNLAIAQGRAQQLRGHLPAELEASPCWELVREFERDAPRNWNETENQEGDPRWTIAGGLMTAGRMIAPKGDPVWGELGSSGNFDDALDVDFPPFAFNSGMRWREVPREECLALGVTASDGTPLDQFLTTAPRTTAGALPAPMPRMSTRKMDRELRDAWLESTHAKTDPQKPDTAVAPTPADAAGKDFSMDAIIARARARSAARKGGAR